MIKTASIILISVIVLVFIMPFFYTVSPYELNPTKILEAPSINHFWVQIDLDVIF